ncbi:hypothetical protein VTK56DRAFT_6226 [Thermocarpiscus australiensis]
MAANPNDPCILLAASYAPRAGNGRSQPIKEDSCERKALLSRRSGCLVGAVSRQSICISVEAGGRSFTGWPSLKQARNLVATPSTNLQPANPHLRGRKSSSKWLPRSRSLLREESCRYRPVTRFQYCPCFVVRIVAQLDGPGQTAMYTVVSRVVVQGS